MPERNIDKIISNGNNVYVVGIKGAGVAGLVQILKAKGYKIMGSDTKEVFFTDGILKRAKIPYKEEFYAGNIPEKVDWVLASNAYLMEPVTNPEILELQRRKIPILSYPEALSYFFNKSYGIAIAGTHGKTTVSAMVAFILQHAKKQPNALIGSEVINWKSNAIVGKGKIFVLEADEYKDAFLQYKPDVIAILNTDWDHPDYFKTHADYKKSFKKFEKNLKKGGKIFRENDFKDSSFKFETSLIGHHNQKNFLAAYKICRYLSLSDKKIREAIKKFKGTARRLETVGKFRGNIVIDDYAHNPQKVEASLEALKNAHPGKKIIVVFQPHTFSRTETFLKEFAKALVIADEISLLDIYASAREAKGTVTSDDIVVEIDRLGCDAVNLKTIGNAEKFFRNNPPKDAVIVAMGAGNVGDLAYILTDDKPKD